MKLTEWNNGSQGYDDRNILECDSEVAEKRNVYGGLEATAGIGMQKS